MYFIRSFRRHAIGILAAAIIFTGGLAPAFADPVEPALAQGVAEEQVAQVYPAFSWRLLERVDLLDAEKQMAAYAFLFVKTDSAFQRAADLQAHVLAAKAAGAGDDELFVFDRIATIITGANDTDSLIYRHFRGIPEFYIELAEARQAGMPAQVVMMSPVSFQVLAETAAGRRGIGGWLAERQDSKSWSRVQEQEQQRMERQEKQRSQLSEEEREFYDQALQERGETQKGKWSAARRRANGGAQ